jgi:hypothetical protein
MSGESPDASKESDHVIVPFPTYIATSARCFAPRYLLIQLDIYYKSGLNWLLNRNT